MSTLQRTTSILRKVFGDSSLIVSLKTTAGDVEGWDSLAHIQLIVALEKEFKVKFKATEIIGFKNVGELVDLLDRKIAASS